MTSVLRRHPVACALSAGAGVAYVMGALFAGAGQAEMSALLHTPFGPIRYVLEPFKDAIAPLLGVFIQPPEIEATFEGLSGFLGVVLYWGSGRMVEVAWERLFRRADLPPG
ncbi:MAG TPA: hypothetical protein VLG48_06895 [Candidatus Methylomirabilis sp.]|nr:hypothetical protein [Candidatus Methylomirabilis sp.]